MGVSKNNGKTPQIIHFSLGFSMIINHPFWGFYPYFWKHQYSYLKLLFINLPPSSVQFLSSSCTLIFSSWWFQPIRKNISQNGNLPQVGMKINKYLKPPWSPSFNHGDPASTMETQLQPWRPRFNHQPTMLPFFFYLTFTASKSLPGSNCLRRFADGTAQKQPIYMYIWCNH